MQIGIISDTHGILKEEVLERLASCTAIFHAGDIGGSEILNKLKSLAPTYVVKGNNDSEEMNLQETLEVSLEDYKFYMIHDLNSLKTLPKGYDFVISGHSHQFNIHYKNKTTWINPGSCGKSRFGLPLTIVILHIKEQVNIELITLSKEKKITKEKK
nr:metallophosphoesterase family protein [uncultured Niameybacter sp.]